jgi:tight adherence protein B
VLAIVLRRQKIVKPVDRMLPQQADVAPVSDKEVAKQIRWSYKVSSFVFRKKNEHSKPDPYRSLIAQADLEMTTEEFMLIRLLFTAAFGFIGYSLVKNMIAAAIAAAIVWMIPRVFLNIRIRAKQKKFDAQLLDSISVISNSLKAGYSFFQALSAVVEETGPPLSKEFRIMLKEMSFGLSVDQAFNNLLQRIYTEDLHLLTTSVLIQRDIGGNLSELLDNIGETIRERQKLNGELKALTAQGRLSGSIVSLLPIALMIAFYFLNRDYIMLLFTNKLGNVMLGIAVIMLMIGIFAINKIVKVEL